MSSRPIEFYSVCFGGQECVLCSICCCHFCNSLDGVTVGEETTYFRYSAHAVDIHSYGIIWYIPMIMFYKYKQSIINFKRAITIFKKQNYIFISLLSICKSFFPNINEPINIQATS